METSIAWHILGLSLVVYPLVRWCVKPGLRLVIRYNGRVSRRELALYRWATRAAAPVIGVILAIQPDALPAHVPTFWVVGLGAISGGFAIIAHHTAETLLPDAMARLLTGASLGRSVAAAAASPPPSPRPPGWDETGTIRTIETVDDTDEVPVIITGRGE